MNPGSQPVVPGLFEQDEGGAYLIGTRCRSCGAAYFPVTLSCRNPDCNEKAVQIERLPHTGFLYSYTVQHYRPPPLFHIDPWEPYVLGLVELEPGLRVMGMLTRVELDQLRIGLPLEVVLQALACDVKGRPVTTYKFAPRADAEGPHT